jgi:hypothetical protein
MMKKIKVILITLLCNVLFAYSESGSKYPSMPSATFAKRVKQMKQQMDEYDSLSEEEKKHSFEKWKEGIEKQHKKDTSIPNYKSEAALETASMRD